MTPSIFDYLPKESNAIFKLAMEREPVTKRNDTAGAKLKRLADRLWKANQAIDPAEEEKKPERTPVTSRSSIGKSPITATDIKRSETYKPTTLIDKIWSPDPRAHPVTRNVGMFLRDLVPWTAGAIAGISAGLLGNAGLKAVRGKEVHELSPMQQRRMGEFVIKAQRESEAKMKGLQHEEMGNVVKDYRNYAKGRVS